MSDLVTRLRQRLGDAWALNDEAADEIERLRTETDCRDRELNALRHLCAEWSRTVEDLEESIKSELDAVKTESFMRGFAIPLIAILFVFVGVIFTTAHNSAEQRTIDEVVIGTESGGPEIPVCDEELWERIKDRCK